MLVWFSRRFQLPSSSWERPIPDVTYMSWPVIRSLLSLHFNDNIHRWDDIAAAVTHGTVNDSVVKPCLVEAVLDTQQ